MEKVYFWCYLMYTDINQCYHVIQGAVEDKMIDKIINQGESVKLAEGKNASPRIVEIIISEKTQIIIEKQHPSIKTITLKNIVLLNAFF